MVTGHRMGRFIELVSGVTPPQGMVEAVHRQTEGNPLFVTEVVRLLGAGRGVGPGESRRAGFMERPYPGRCARGHRHPSIHKGLFRYRPMCHRHLSRMPKPSCTFALRRN